MSWLRDPLVAFLVAGAGIFILTDWLGEDDIPYRVEVLPQDIQRLSDQWSMQMRRPPTNQELDGLIAQFIKEEIYYREAQRLGLDRNDTIVRRRMVQKLTFLTEDIATATPLDEAQLEEYYNTHLDDYRLPERVSFRHRYFSSDRRANAQQDAKAALDRDDSAGDPFMLQREYALRSEREVRDLFGSNFASKIIALKSSEDWQGPIQSAYGWHIVRITDRAPASVEPFERVRSMVLSDAQQAQRNAANEAYFEDLKARYEVHIVSDA